MVPRDRLACGVSLLLVTIVLVAGCGDGDSEATTAPARPAVEELEAALLTPGEIGSGWRTAGAEPMDAGAAHDLGGRCPGGSSFARPAAATFIIFEPPGGSGDNTISEGLLTFETREDLDTWTAAFESCVGEQWEELEDPVEYVSVETIAVADHGEDRAGFLFHFAHGEGEVPAHDSRWFLVRVGSALVLVTGEDYEPEDSQDEELLTDVLARAVQKAEAALHA